MKQHSGQHTHSKQQLQRNSINFSFPLLVVPWIWDEFTILYVFVEDEKISYNTIIERLCGHLHGNLPRKAFRTCFRYFILFFEEFLSLSYCIFLWFGHLAIKEFLVAIAKGAFHIQDSKMVKRMLAIGDTRGKCYRTCLKLFFHLFYIFLSKSWDLKSEGYYYWHSPHDFHKNVNWTSFHFFL